MRGQHLPVLARAANFLVGSAEGLAQQVDVHRFLEVGEGAQLQALLPVLFAAVAGEHDDLDSRAALLDAPQHLQPVDAGHLEVEDHDIRLVLLHHLQGRLAVVGHGRADVTHLQPFGKGLHELALVVHQQHPRGHLEVHLAVDVGLVKALAHVDVHVGDARDFFNDGAQFFLQPLEQQHLFVDAQADAAVFRAHLHVVSLPGQGRFDARRQLKITHRLLGRGRDLYRVLAQVAADDVNGFFHAKLVHGNQHVVEIGCPGVGDAANAVDPGGAFLVGRADGPEGLFFR